MFLDTEDVNLYYEVKGEGEPLLQNCLQNSTKSLPMTDAAVHEAQSMEKM